MQRVISILRQRDIAWSVLALAFVQFVGALGLISSLSDFFLRFTALNLMLLFGVFCYHQFRLQKSSLSWVIVIGVLGWLVELLGVHTGFPFGEYSYGEPLGFQPLAVPTTIGMTWSMMALGAHYWSSKLLPNKWLSSLCAAACMVLTDVVIEPVAIHFDFWSWENGTPPFANYVGWLGVGFLMQLLLHSRKTKIARQTGHIFCILLSFFALSWILISL